MKNFNFVAGDSPEFWKLWKWVAELRVKKYNVLKLEAEQFDSVNYSMKLKILQDI